MKKRANLTTSCFAGQSHPRRAVTDSQSLNSGNSKESFGQKNLAMAEIWRFSGIALMWFWQANTTRYSIGHADCWKIFDKRCVGLLHLALVVYTPPASNDKHHHSTTNAQDVRGFSFPLKVKQHRNALEAAFPSLVVIAVVKADSTNKVFSLHITTAYPTTIS
jgi:hypothetical protein